MGAIPQLRFFFHYDSSLCRVDATCGCLTVTDLHNLIERGPIGRCGLVGMGMALLVGVCHYGGGL